MYSFIPSLRALASTLLLLSITGYAARAQDSSTAQQKTAPYAMPELPAVTFVGGQANTVTRPITPRALATELINGVDSSGRVKQGLAVAVTPFALAGGKVTLAEYQGSWFKAMLYNAQASASTVRTAATNGATDLGVGLRFTVYDASDPMRSKEYTAAVSKILLETLPDDPSDASVAATASKARALIADYRKAWRKDHWNEPSFSLASAGGWRLNESKLIPDSPNRWLGWSAWASGGLPLFKTAGQFIGQVRYINQQRVNLADRSIQAVNQFDYGGRLILGTALLNFSAEVVGVNRSSPLPNVQKSGIEWAGAVEFRATEGIWISTSVGHKLPVVAEPTSVVVFGGLRWEFNTEPRLQVGPGN